MFSGLIQVGDLAASPEGGPAARHRQNKVGLTQLACCACGKAVRSFPIVCGFSARSGKNRTQKIGTYHAAAGKKRGVVTPKNAPA